jgi:hypothetical protein
MVNMSSKPHGVLGTRNPILTNDLLSRLYALNLDYLDLIIAERSGSSANGLSCLPERVMEALANCSAESRQALASTAFSLYSLGFEDQHFWRSAVHIGQQPIDARYGMLSTMVMQSAFCEIALLHAWHVAVTQPFAARVVYGMSTPIINRMCLMQLWQLKRIAADYPGLLMPRWSSNPCFWPDMINFASAGDWRRLETVQQLGHQLIAVELQESAAPESAARQRQRHLMQQRLRRAAPPKRP